MKRNYRNMKIIANRQNQKINNLESKSLSQVNTFKLNKLMNTTMRR